MADLRKRFGRLLAAHRRRLGHTQEALAEAAGLSVDMISKLEVGATGARFPAIERLAEALKIDPAELFTSDLPTGSMSRGAYGQISAALAQLDEADLIWVKSILDAALSSRGKKASSSPGAAPVGRSTKPLSSSKKANRKAH
ncbi:helix-turn-helix domain-containing protein [Afipia massiliensis]|uniref:Helix-turn-helix domain-containing protein n=1 Tax=Afipia massiliensis TaxID=211460 RepID=A0A4U6BRQ3_9BRAD|nr:helix-turn-helix domain-containing protein [Afipia massiliensis]TKT71424.1 helix-turn-helix domain-containing protein [Afipia massiliensis]